jgi:hypothetical protein
LPRERRSVETERENRGAGAAKPGRDHLWPWFLAIGLALVVVVNGIFIWIAVNGADEVAPSYSQGDR